MTAQRICAPQEVKADICLLAWALVHVSSTTVAGAGHACNQGQVVGVAALSTTCADALHKVVADGAAAVLGGHGAVAAACEGLQGDMASRAVDAL